MTDDTVVRILTIAQAVRDEASLLHPDLTHLQCRTLGENVVRRLRRDTPEVLTCGEDS